MRRLGGRLQTVLVVGVGDGGLVYGDVPLNLLPPVLTALTPASSITLSWRNLTELFYNFLNMPVQDIRLISEGRRHKHMRLISTIDPQGTSCCHTD